MRGRGGCGVSANEYTCSHGAQINVEDLTPYFTYEWHNAYMSEVTHSESMLIVRQCIMTQYSVGVAAK